MAEIVGLPGRNAAEESFRRFRRNLIAGAIALLGCGFIGGLLMPLRWFGFVIPGAAMFLLGAIGIVLMVRSDRLMARYEKERKDWRKGEEGETSVSDVLCGLGDDYTVVNDVTKRFGNIDHIVVGPTGIYVIDTKNWRGTVTAASDGELLCNGKKTGKREVHNLLCAAMDLREKLKALCDKAFYVRALMVFPSARVDANFGATQQVHCLRDDRVVGYIQNTEYANRVEAEDLQRVRRAIIQLAGMDERFATRPAPRATQPS